MKFNIPIIVITFNRPNSLIRLLVSLSNAYYPMDINIDLIISIDYSANNECLNVANEFEWKYGGKKIIQHDENLGLRKHIISCGNIALKNDGVIILEDDCFVAKDFYNYALQAYQFYRDDKKIAGISLYSYQFNDNVKMPFEPLKDGSDVYFMQVPSSSGQLWTKNQWKLFMEFYNSEPKVSKNDKIPEYVKTWPESSWKKYFYKYMVENDLYFVYPQISLSTNFGDIGQHTTGESHLHQVTLNSYFNQLYKFTPISKSNNIYDAYFEILPECLLKYGFEFKHSFCIDTYLSKQNFVIEGDYVITTYPSTETVKKYGVSLKPLINNIIYNISGEGLYIVSTSKYLKATDKNNLQNIFKHQYAIPFELGYEVGYNKGEENIRNTRTFKMGRFIFSILNFKYWKIFKSKLK